MDRRFNSEFMPTVRTNPIFINPARDCMDTTTLRPPASKMPAARIAPATRVKYYSIYIT